MTAAPALTSEIGKAWEGFRIDVPEEPWSAIGAAWANPQIPAPNAPTSEIGQS